ncbi:MAG: hypothetical protein HYR83_08600, partial [Planctomycetes bacterium]|nr:hypothetical protein [Planctomycetota bacterium]
MDGLETSKHRKVETSKHQRRKTMGLFLAGTVAVCGCATLPLGGVKKGDDKALSPAAKKAEEQKQENLTEVEDFLSRTQQYAQPDPAKSQAPPPQSLREFLDTMDKTPEASTGASQSAKPRQAPPSDQAVANAQVVVGGTPTKPQQAIPALQKVAVKWTDPTVAESTNAQADKPGSANNAIDTRSAEDSLWDRLL